MPDCTQHKEIYTPQIIAGESNTIKQSHHKNKKTNIITFNSFTDQAEKHRRKKCEEEEKIAINKRRDKFPSPNYLA